MNPARVSHQTLVPVLVALVVGACSEHASAPVDPIDEDDVAVVVIRDFAFSAPTITIDRGSSVRWRSTTGTFHTVTPDGHQAFATQQLNATGQTFDVRFDTPGTYQYFCEPHRALGMTGEVVVR